MKQLTSLLTFLCFFLFCNAELNAQIRVLDIGFGEYPKVAYGAWAVDFIEANEPHQVFSYLEDPNSIDYETLEGYGNYLEQYFKYDPKALPPSMPIYSYTGDTLYYERHYYVWEGDEIKYLAQLLIQMNAKAESSNIINISFYHEDQFIDRDLEIRALKDGSWNKKISTFLPSNQVDFKTQTDKEFLVDYHRTIQRDYVNEMYNFGFNYDSDYWTQNEEATFFKNLKQNSNPDDNIWYIGFLEGKKKRRSQSYPCVILARAEAEIPYELVSKEDLEKSFDVTLFEKESFENEKVDLDYFNMDRPILDKTRKMLTIQSEARYTQGTTLYISQTFFMGGYDLINLQLITDEKNREEAFQHYLEMVNSFIEK